MPATKPLMIRLSEDERARIERIMEQRGYRRMADVVRQALIEMERRETSFENSSEIGPQTP